MIVIPAIDIIRGKVVRLYQGDFDKEKCYSDDPVKTALMWQEKGAPLLHIVDLDGARYGEVKNRDVISGIIEALDMPCQIGGGLRELGDMKHYLKQGAKRLVLGTKALEDLDYLREVVSRFPAKIAASIDFSGGRVVKKGWQKKTELAPEAVAVKMQEIGVDTVIVTDIRTDGTLGGPNVEGLKKILDAVDVSVIASGGISGLEDIRRLKDIKSDNLKGVIIGCALYENKIDLKEAIKAAG